MKFKIIGNSLIYIDEGNKIIEGENKYAIIEIETKRYRNKLDLMSLSFRLTAISVSDNTKSACQVLMKSEIDENTICLKGEINSDFSAIMGKVVFMLTGVNSDEIVAKFDSRPITITDDISLDSMPTETVAEQLFNQAQLEAQKAMDAATETQEMLDNFTLDVASKTVVGGIKSGNDISVSSDGIVTVNSVNGKTVGKSVPADAVFTDTVYTLPKATKDTLGGVKVDGTSIIADKSGVISAVGVSNHDGKLILPTASTETLGGVKVDGKTITAAEDGTISALESENLKGEISSLKSSQYSISKLAIQIAHPNNYLIYDDLGKSSVMVAIPKFYLDEVIEGAEHIVHPAFMVNGVEQDVIYISKYQNIIENEHAYSLPMKDPAVNINSDQAWTYCKNKGAGWHLMTNAEWAAIALWCKKNGTIPKGNNNYGKDVSESNLPQKAIAATIESNGKTAHTLTGSGRKSWYHDGTFAGIADLNGNVWEWISDMRLVYGELQVIPYNNAASGKNDISVNSTDWKAINANTTSLDDLFITPNGNGTTENSVKLDWVNNHWQWDIIITNQNNKSQTAAFAAITSKDVGITAKMYLQATTLLPNDSEAADSYGTSILVANNGAEERYGLRGGALNSSAGAGVFTLGFSNSRSDSHIRLGGRSAYINTSAYPLQTL